MQYGYFDDEAREYVITRPDTPAPWANYLGSPEYGAIISNNAGGYSFEKSGAHGRILRYIFNQFDQPGRYIYLRDDDEADYWSASWQPVGKDLKTYRSECRHGTGYSRLTAEYAGIRSEAAYYVPLHKTYEVWKLKLANSSGRKRHLSVFGYCEFTNDCNYEQDQVNLQYTLFITRTYFKQNLICQTINENIREDVDGNKAASRFFGLAGSQVASYDGDKAEFLGNYHGYQNPRAVEQGSCSNSLNYNSNSCGALHTRITLQPGEEREIAFICGMKEEPEAQQILESYQHPGKTAEEEIRELKEYWHGKLSHLQVHTPSEAFNHMVNTWNAYQCFITFIWSRAASFLYCGLRNGYGYRDTVQDIQGILHLDPEMALEKIRFMLSAQVNNGGGLPLVKYDHHAGQEDTPEDASYVKATGHPAYRADDALWLFPTIYKYIAETGNLAFLDEVILFANGGEGSVYEHLKRAIDFSMQRLGVHGMPAGLHADWNDCLRLGSKGESTFVAMQLYQAFSILLSFAEERQDAPYLEYLRTSQKELGEKIQKFCWENDRFVRGFKEDGQVIGSSKDPEASMWLNPQSWAVISGLADREQALKAMDLVEQELNTPYGAMLMNPPYIRHAFDGALMLLYNPSTKENGGIFSQSQGWLILAEALLGHGKRAFAYFEETSPAAMNDRAEIRRLEPYCHGQFTEGKDSPHAGRSHVHWLTGTASTVMVGCVEGILGLRPDFYGIRVDPSISPEWRELTIEKDFRGKHLSIRVENPDQKESGVRRILVNGEPLDGNYIPVQILNPQNEIIVQM
ncbi:MAG: N,N'-diacetylchitobiose phosphorylase [Parasporobacterium sp.]|nr:N,N'-diacetylchitobiose phosphorylase [Parasporobacterium sp.]